MPRSWGVSWCRLSQPDAEPRVAPKHGSIGDPRAAAPSGVDVHLDVHRAAEGGQGRSCRCLLAVPCQAGCVRRAGRVEGGGNRFTSWGPGRLCWPGRTQAWHSSGLRIWSCLRFPDGWPGQLPGLGRPCRPGAGPSVAAFPTGDPESSGTRAPAVFLIRCHGGWERTYTFAYTHTHTEACFWSFWSPVILNKNKNKNGECGCNRRLGGRGGWLVASFTWGQRGPRGLNSWALVSPAVWARGAVSSGQLGRVLVGLGRGLGTDPGQGTWD